MVDGGSHASQLRTSDTVPVEGYFAFKRIKSFSCNCSSLALNRSSLACNCTFSSGSLQLLISSSTPSIFFLTLSMSFLTSSMSFTMSFLTSSMSFLTARIDGVEEYIKNCIDPNEKNNYKPRRNDYVLLGGTITC